MAEDSEAPWNPRRRTRVWFSIGAAAAIVTTTWLLSPWTPWPKAALAIDRCDGAELAAELDVVDEGLERDHPALLERGLGDHRRVASAITNACRWPPEHVREFTRVASDVMDDIRRDVMPDPASELANFQFGREIARHCGGTDVLYDVARQPAERRAVFFQERCDLPRPMSGYSIVLFRYLTDAGVDEETSLRALTHFYGSPFTIPLNEPVFVQKLPATTACFPGLRNGVVVRITATDVSLPTLPVWALPEIAGGETEFAAQLEHELTREFGKNGAGTLVFAADAESPADAVADVLSVAPPSTEAWLLARDPAPNEGSPVNAIRVIPVSDIYRETVAANDVRSVGDLVEAMEPGLKQHAFGCEPPG